MDSSTAKIYFFRSKKIIKSAFYLFLGFQGFISKKPLKGPEEVEIWWSKVPMSMFCEIYWPSITIFQKSKKSDPHHSLTIIIEDFHYIRSAFVFLDGVPAFLYTQKDMRMFFVVDWLVFAFSYAFL